jgi:predicted RNA-binding Zn ribbon-like protein
MSAPTPLPPKRPGAPYRFVGERLWLDFVNSDDAVVDRDAPPFDILDEFDRFLAWLEAAGVTDAERAHALSRRAQQQPTGANAALYEARRMRNVLRALAERGGAAGDRATVTAVAEINRMLGRSAGSRRVEANGDGTFARTFVTAGDVFAGLAIPIIESAADSLVAGELARVKRCRDPRCDRVFYDATKNGSRRWCEMATCGNRAKAARHRKRTGNGERR